MPRRTLAGLGRLVREKRGSKKLRETAKDIGVSAATLMRIEAGRTPDVATFGKICEWLEVDPGDFIGGPSSKKELKGRRRDKPKSRQPDYSVHLKADKEVKPATINAIAEMIRLSANISTPEE